MLSPVVSVLVRDVNGCDPDDVVSCASRQSVTFGNEWQDAMMGTWPIVVKDHGIRYHAWVIGGRAHDDDVIMVMMVYYKDPICMYHGAYIDSQS